MRIIAKNHDYYDSALAFGHDPTVVFERKEEKFAHRHRKDSDWPKGYHFMNPRMGARGRIHLNQSDVTRRGWEINYLPFTVAFCGRLYPGMRLHTYGHHPYRDKDYVAYTFEDYATILSDIGLDFIKPKYKRSYSLDDRIGSARNEKDCEEYFGRAGEDHVPFFGENRKPIVVWEESLDYHGTMLHFNPELKKWSFYKVFDAYRAFQELDMFVSGVMAREVHVPNKKTNKLPNPVEIGDDDLRDKKGFDDKSFRKAPTKKR